MPGEDETVHRPTFQEASSHSKLKLETLINQHLARFCSSLRASRSQATPAEAGVCCNIQFTSCHPLAH